MPDDIFTTLHSTSVVHYECESPFSAPPLVDPSIGGVVGGTDALNDGSDSTYGEVLCMGNDADGTRAFDILGIELEQLVIPDGYEFNGARWHLRARFPEAPTYSIGGVSQPYPWNGVATNSTITTTDGSGDPLPTPFQTDHEGDGTFFASPGIFWPSVLYDLYYGVENYAPPVNEWVDMVLVSPDPSIWDVEDFGAKLTVDVPRTLIGGSYRGGVTTGGSANSMPIQIAEFSIECRLSPVVTGTAAPLRRYPRSYIRRYPRAANRRVGKSY